MSGANQSISAGIGGFLAFFLLALVLWLLMRNMNKRLQNLKYNEEAEEARRRLELNEAVSSRPSRAHPAGPSHGPGVSATDGPASPASTP
ncbi:MAG TPA: hypothetical protein VES01_00115 [Dermatophilaceae bacterium]|nr:hypothetical protein [Dermatophilaceae bacterium]